VIDFLYEVGVGNVVDEQQMNTLDRHLVNRADISNNRSNRARTDRIILVGRVKAAQRDLDSFDDLKKLKEAKEKRKPCHNLASLGPKQLQKLIDSNILTGRQLVQLYTDIGNSKPRASINRLKSKLSGTAGQREGTIKRWVDGIEVALKVRETALREAKEALNSHDSTVEDLPVPPGAAAVPVVPVAAAAGASTTAASEPSQLPKFSKFLDKSGYNAKILSAHLVDQVRHSYFLNRKPLMKLKMMKRGGYVLKFDFQYGVPSRGARRQAQRVHCFL
jgi:hypothetical protein